MGHGLVVGLIWHHHASAQKLFPNSKHEKLPDSRRVEPYLDHCIRRQEPAPKAPACRMPVHPSISEEFNWRHRSGHDYQVAMRCCDVSKGSINSAHFNPRRDVNLSNDVPKWAAPDALCYARPLTVSGLCINSTALCSITSPKISTPPDQDQNLITTI